MSQAQGWTLIALLIGLLLAEGGLVLRLVRTELRAFEVKLDALVTGLDRRLQLLEDRR
jgi:hypothetical protein